MKFHLINPEPDRQISDILLKIHLSMNGIVLDQMTKSGIIYKKNFGVSIPRLKEISKLYIPNHDLAQRLWNLQTRETMILATLLQPIDKFTPEIAQNWVESFNQVEIVEQACMNLFCKLPDANFLCLKWTQSDKIWIKITGFLLAARLVAKLNRTEMEAIIDKALQSSEADNFHLYKTIAVCLSCFCQKNKEIATYILKEINVFHTSTSIGQQYILNEVKQEILFLNIL